jgi:hypothetical protein
VTAAGLSLVGYALMEGRRRGVKYVVVTMCIGRNDRMSEQPTRAPLAEVARPNNSTSLGRQTGCLPALNQLLIRAVKNLGDAGQTDAACRIAAEACALLRHPHPRHAVRMNGSAES